MVDDRVLGAVEGLGEQTFGQSHAHSISEALPKRPGRRFDTRGHTELRVAGSPRMQLPKALEFLDRQIVAGEMQQSVDQHRPMPVRQHEAVAVDPVGIGRIVLQVVTPEYLGNVGHAHRHPRVAGIGGLDGIDGEKAQRVGAATAELAGLRRHNNLLQSGHGNRLQEVNLPVRQRARRFLSISCMIIGVKMICMARPILPPGQTMMFGRDMNESCSMLSR